ncbi:MAG: hypothetical protein C4527_08660 [Candidatus Omnitrophota bacterium]|jgi:predicted nucleotidyltransferase|nr:MAG: hypothetical protein C4527_08660 [Candidatus Omnitrophota bacterium]
MPFNFRKLNQRWQKEESERKHRSEKMRSTCMEKAVPVLLQYGVQRIVLFGSVLKERCEESSDLDILAMPIPNDRYWQCLHDLREATGVDVDLYTENDNAEFVKKVLRRGEIIYERIR